MEQNTKTTKRNALLAAFGCAVGYLLGGKLLALLPVPALLPERLLSFLHHCAAAPIAEELVFRGAIQRLQSRWAAGRQCCCRRCCSLCSTAPRRAWPMRWCAALRWGRCGTAPAKYGRARFCIH